MRYDVVLTIRPVGMGDITIPANGIEAAGLAEILATLSQALGAWPDFLPPIVAVSVSQQVDQNARKSPTSGTSHR